MQLLVARLAQELAITAAHQGKPGLHEPDRPAA